MNNRDENRFKILFIIVTWNRKDILDRCLVSIAKHVRCPHRILIVDNASSDGTAAMVKSEYPGVILIENRENVGFSKANNQGIRYLRECDLRFDYVIFFNDDARFEDASLLSLIDYMDNDEEIKAGIPSVFTGSGKLQTGIGGYDLSISSAFHYFSFLSIVFPSVFKGFFIDQNHYRENGIVAEVDWISGVCFVLRAELASSLEFDEQFFMYAEDIALCRQVRRYGKIVYFPFSRVFHRMESLGSGEGRTLWLDSLFRYYRMQNEKRFLGKLWLLKTIFVIGFLARAFGYNVLSAFSRKIDPRKRKALMEYCRHILSGFFSE